MSTNSVDPGGSPIGPHGGDARVSRHLWKWLPWALLGFFWWGLFGFIAKVGTADVEARDMQVLLTQPTAAAGAGTIADRRKRRTQAIPRGESLAW